jgi:hypothetical protein
MDLAIQDEQVGLDHFAIARAQRQRGAEIVGGAQNPERLCQGLVVHRAILRFSLASGGERAPNRGCICIAAIRYDRAMSLERELRDTSDSLMRALDELHDLETQKRAQPTGTETFVQLAERVEDLAVEVLRRTEREASLAQDVKARREAGGAVGRPIDAIPVSHRDLATILSEWRDAERTLAAADPAGPQSSAAASDVRRLREEYRMAHEARSAKKPS